MPRAKARHVMRRSALRAAAVAVEQEVKRRLAPGYAFWKLGNPYGSGRPCNPAYSPAVELKIGQPLPDLVIYFGNEAVARDNPADCGVTERVDGGGVNLAAPVKTDILRRAVNRALDLEAPWSRSRPSAVRSNRHKCRPGYSAAAERRVGGTAAGAPAEAEHHHPGGSRRRREKYRRCNQGRRAYAYLNAKLQSTAVPGAVDPVAVVVAATLIALAK